MIIALDQIGSVGVAIGDDDDDDDDDMKKNFLELHKSE
jgi:hypothetical protein